MVAGADVLSAVLSDLAAEGAWLDAVVADLDDAGWLRPTPAPGWTIGHQVAHLAWTDDQALCAATDPEAFAALARRMLAGEVTVDGAPHVPSWPRRWQRSRPVPGCRGTGHR